MKHSILTALGMDILYDNCGGMCSCGCGQPLTQPEIHHGLITKARAMGLKGVKKRRLLDHPINLFLVNHGCHQNIPDPGYFWLVACERHGVETVRKWYDQMQGLFTTKLENIGE